MLAGDMKFFSKEMHWERLTILGVFVFFAGHFVAASFYPGGHQWNYESVGYNVLLNFWCDLIWPTTYNGDPNPASIYGIITTVFLTLSLAVLFIEFARTVPMSQLSRNLIMFAGVISMVFASLIFTEIHTFAIYAAAGFAMIALVPMIKALIDNQYRKLVIGGGVTIFLLIFCIAQLAIKFAYVTYPMVQKFAFVIGLSWVIAICMKISSLKKPANLVETSEVDGLNA